MNKSFLLHKPLTIMPTEFKESESYSCRPSQGVYLHTMRLAVALIVLSGPVFAWQFSASPICTLTQNTAEGTLTVTYDASLPEYTITITLPDATWPYAPSFAMAFAGGQPISIQTNRHALSDDGKSLTVKDTGFGNVLNGLQFNERAYARSGDMIVGFTLSDIEPAIRDFRNCPGANLA